MPNMEQKPLREKFREECPMVANYFSYVEDWWLSTLKERIEGKRKELTHADGGELSYFTHTMVQGYNKAIDDLLTELK